jgi:uncharacterized protein (DUF1778 family)
MSQAHTQISAYISKETKDLVEQYVRACGAKKGFLIESALLHHLKALEELPADVIIPPRLVVCRESGEAILEQLEKPSESTDAMKALFRND